MDKPVVRDAHARPAVGASGNGVWSLALDLLQGVPKGRLLEIAAGGGTLAARLAEEGYEVVGSDLGVQWSQPDLPFVRADLDAPLPFQDASFDGVVFTEGYGYVENGAALVREVRRVLKPEGCFVVTVPNILSLESRLKFLITGTYRWFPHPMREGRTKQQLLDTYRDPTRVTTLRFILETNGFSVERTAFGGTRPLRTLAGLGFLLRGLLRMENAFRKKRKTPSFVNGHATLFRSNVGVLARRIGG